jgi:hypothetical protein
MFKNDYRDSVTYIALCIIIVWSDQMYATYRDYCGQILHHDHMLKPVLNKFKSAAQLFGESVRICQTATECTHALSFI